MLHSQKGYVPAHMLHDEDMYAFQARLNSSNDYVYETEAPARFTDSWNNSEDPNYGQFCRHMGSSMTQTWITAKMWDYANNNSATLKEMLQWRYSGVYVGIYSQWFTNSSASRTFTRLSGDQLYIQANDVLPIFSQMRSYTPLCCSSGSLGKFFCRHCCIYTFHYSWYRTGHNAPAQCPGCTGTGGSYSSLPYGQTTILNDPSHHFEWDSCTCL